MPSKAIAQVPASSDVFVDAQVLQLAPQEMLALEMTAPDRFAGTPAAYPWGWIFGGHLMAQALVAAGATVDPAFVPHSLHASFVQKGDTSRGVSYDVERLRDGRSYCVRRVVGSQLGSALITVQAGFAAAHERPPALRPNRVAPPPPPADDMRAGSWTTAFERLEVPTETVGRVRWWYRLCEPIGAAELTQSAALAFLTDDPAAEAVADAHDAPPFDRLAKSEWTGASLDHAIWFHAPLRADAWHLHDFRCVNYSGGRGLAFGMIFDRDGRHVATVSQETHLTRP